MKRYAAFEFMFYYPDGGWDDLVGLADTIDDAKKLCGDKDSAQIVDLLTGTVVSQRDVHGVWKEPA